MAEKLVSPSTMETEPDDRSRRATSSISMDDIQAAQALEDLRSGLCGFLKLMIID